MRTQLLTFFSKILPLVAAVFLFASSAHPAQAQIPSCITTLSYSQTDNRLRVSLVFSGTPPDQPGRIIATRSDVGENFANINFQMASCTQQGSTCTYVGEYYIAPDDLPLPLSIEAVSMVDGSRFCGNPVSITAQDTSSATPPPDRTGRSVEEGVTYNTLFELDPLANFGADAIRQGATPGEIISRFLTLFAFPIAGLILFVMIVWGGFEILSGASNKKSLDQGKQRITSAITGFLLLFCSYWIIQLIEFVFRIQIL